MWWEETKILLADVMIINLENTSVSTDSKEVYQN